MSRIVWGGNLPKEPVDTREEELRKRLGERARTIRALTERLRQVKEGELPEETAGACVKELDLGGVIGILDAMREVLNKQAEAYRRQGESILGERGATDTDSR